MVYAEVIEYLKGLPDFTHRKKQLQVLLREVYPYFLTYAILNAMLTFDATHRQSAELKRLKGSRPKRGMGVKFRPWVVFESSGNLS